MNDPYPDRYHSYLTVSAVHILVTHILGLSARFSDPLSVPFAPQGPGSAGGTGSESVERIESDRALCSSLPFTLPIPSVTRHSSSCLVYSSHILHPLRPCGAGRRPVDGGRRVETRRKRGSTRSIGKSGAVYRGRARSCRLSPHPRSSDNRSATVRFPSRVTPYVGHAPFVAAPFRRSVGNRVASAPRRSSSRPSAPSSPPTRAVILHLVTFSSLPPCPPLTVRPRRVLRRETRSVATRWMTEGRE